MDRFALTIYPYSFGLSLPPYNCGQAAKSLVNGLVVGKILSYVGIDYYDVNAFLITFRIFASNSAAEVVLLPHVRIILSLLLISTFPCLPPIRR